MQHKTIIILSVLLVVLFSSNHSTYAQETTIKLSPIPLFIGNIKLQGERKLTDNLSVELGVNYLIKRKVPFIDRFSNSSSGTIGNSTATVSENYDKIKFDGFGFMPESTIV